jgi:hypothetical protein
MDWIALGSGATLVLSDTWALQLMGLCKSRSVPDLLDPYTDRILSPGQAKSVLAVLTDILTRQRVSVQAPCAT